MDGYAPIVIVTLNRVDKLRRMIDSLLQNPEAKDTELYISVDYPPSPKYVKGHTECCEYVKTISGFKQVHAYIQERNLGSIDNFYFLLDHVKEKYDRMISLEDDNVLAPNFLRYINLALRKFESSKRVVWVGSQIPRDIDYSKCDGNAYLSRHMSAWGNAFWLEKYYRIKDEITELFQTTLSHSIKLQHKLYMLNQESFLVYAKYIAGIKPNLLFPNGDVRLCDMAVTIYCLTKDTYCVYPTVKKSLNLGYDGTGENVGSKRDYYAKLGQIGLDTDTSMECLRMIDQKSPEYHRCYKQKQTLYRQSKKKMIWAWSVLLAHDLLPERIGNRVVKYLSSKMM